MKNNARKGVKAIATTMKISAKRSLKSGVHMLVITKQILQKIDVNGMQLLANADKI